MIEVLNWAADHWFLALVFAWLGSVTSLGIGIAASAFTFALMVSIGARNSKGTR